MWNPGLAAAHQALRDVPIDTLRTTGIPQGVPTPRALWFDENRHNARTRALPTREGARQIIARASSTPNKHTYFVRNSLTLVGAGPATRRRR